MANLTTYEVENWEARRFGVARGRNRIGMPEYFNIQKTGYAIKGFWRAHDGALFGIKHVLIGKG